MSDPFIAALMQAETNRKVVHQQCVTARQEVLKRYNSAYEAVARRGQLGHDTPTNRRKASSLTELCRKDANLSVEQLMKAAYIAKDILHAREKQYKLACATEAEARQDLDNYRLSQGRLRHFEPNTTASDTKGPIQLWRAQVNAAFDDYDNMNSFPAPPPHPEGTKHSLSCRSRPRWRQKTSDDRLIQACDCAVRAAFLGGTRSKEETISLKTERLRWDPDLFPGALRAQASNEGLPVDIVANFTEAMPPYASTAYLDRLTRNADDLKTAFATAQGDVDEARAEQKRCERLKEKLSKQRQDEEAGLGIRSAPNSRSTPLDELFQSMLSLHLSVSEAEDASEKASEELRNARMNLDAIKGRLFHANSVLEEYQRWQRSTEEAKERDRVAAEAAEKHREEEKKFRRWVEAQGRKMRERQEAEDQLAQQRARIPAERERQAKAYEAKQRQAKEREARQQEARQSEASERDARAREEKLRQEQQRRAREKGDWPRDWFRQEKARLEDACSKLSPSARPPTKLIAIITRQNIVAFFAVFEAMPTDRSTLKAFPEPPSESCEELACRTSAADRKLEACSCNIKKVFSGVKNIKAMRNRFHPDKFARCPEEIREVMQKMAEEIFVVLSGMI
ncbi:hypothetical protein LTR78_000885 [Recurvomyces mirabilis]|uniref:Uncharacterized protein n=1 Tax=Recurvomyces mirabilis TaxID=574656 RepID=A0AAE0WWN6_9PEZI|nr:hypothetical protein LTR78_000885 [Recurvomyces mirabilis]KAK5158856.1 hypothetical protein LTS14_002964 [Recurvomyces mirabilis]